MGTIKEDINTSAEWISQALKSSGYCADFTPQSLWEIDRFFDEHAVDGAAKPSGLLAENLGSRLFAFGAYIGEVVRRNLGGEWVGDDKDPRTEITVELHLRDGRGCRPIQHVMMRFKTGAKNGFAAWGANAGLQVGLRPDPPPKNFWRKLFG